MSTFLFFLLCIILMIFGYMLITITKDILAIILNYSKKPHSNWKFFNNSVLYKSKTDKIANEANAQWPIGDCAERALSVVFNQSWQESFDMLVNAGRELFKLPDHIDALKKVFEKQGCTYLSTEKVNSLIERKFFIKRNKVHQIVKRLPKGKFLIICHGYETNRHIVGIIDNIYYDAYDSGKFRVESIIKVN